MKGQPDVLILYLLTCGLISYHPMQPGTMTRAAFEHSTAQQGMTTSLQGSV
jgi:hypothetical protein